VRADKSSRRVISIVGRQKRWREVGLYRDCSLDVAFDSRITDSSTASNGIIAKSWEEGRNQMSK